MDQIWLLVAGVFVVVVIVMFFVLLLKKRRRTVAPTNASEKSSFRLSTDGADGGPTLSEQSRFERELSASRMVNVDDGMSYYGRRRHF